uniref:Uncharacterized protein n=1 Tax=Mycena chlorophos TaxID=658473 RepID=A0ABQ0M7H5_MYCCL|nr:predicted protein [Mycena chlorophos]
MLDWSIDRTFITSRQILLLNPTVVTSSAVSWTNDHDDVVGLCPALALFKLSTLRVCDMDMIPSNDSPAETLTSDVTNLRQLSTAFESLCTDLENRLQDRRPSFWHQSREQEDRLARVRLWRRRDDEVGGELGDRGRRVRVDPRRVCDPST